MQTRRYVRHLVYDRTRHSEHFLTWLDEQAERLQLTPEKLFNTFLIQEKLTFQQVESLPDGVHDDDGETNE